jgi:hypothetical protein
MSIKTSSFTLKKPIQAHGEELKVLDLREPTYEDIEKYGIPFDITENGDVKISTKSALGYIPELAGIPRSSAATLAPSDIFKLSMLVINFFTESAE